MTCLVSVEVVVAVVVDVAIVGVVGIVVDSLLSSELNMLTVLVLVVDLDGGDLDGVLQDGHRGHRLGERRLHPRSGYRSRTGGPGVRIDVHRDGCGET